MCWVPLAVAQTTSVTVRALSLSECVRTAVQPNFDVKIEEKGVDIARHQLSLDYGEYDPVLRAGTSRGVARSPRSTRGMGSFRAGSCAWTRPS